MSILDLCRKSDIETDFFINAVNNLIKIGAKTFIDLDPLVKEEIVGRLLKCMLDPYEFLVEHNNRDVFINYFSDYLIFGLDSDRIQYTDNLLLNAVTYYALDLNDYFLELVSNKYDDN